MPCGNPKLKTITLKGVEVEYELHRSPRRRATMALRIVDNQPRVSVPRFASESSVRAFIYSKADWILDRINTSRGRIRDQLRPGGAIPWLGTAYPVVARTKSGGQRLEFDFDHEAGQFVIDPSCEALEDAAQRWLRQAAIERFRCRVEELAPIVGVDQPKRVQVRNQQTLWGSASALGTVSLNWRVVFAPQTMIDYLITHELCHFNVRNHPPEFWRLLDRFVPGNDSRSFDREFLRQSVDWTW